MTCAAVGGAADPYIFMSGRPAVVPMSPMPGAAGVPGFAAMPAGVPGLAAMPVGPSGPARAGVITAAVTATTKAGTAARLAARANGPMRRTGRSASEGRHSSAAHPAIRASSRTVLTTSSPPAGSGLPASGPIGRPAVRDATYTTMTRAFPARPSHSHSRDGRHSTTAAHIIWAQATTRKNAPYRAYCAKCSNMTAKWIAAAPTDSEARPPRIYGLALADVARTSWPVKAGALMSGMLGSPARAGIGLRSDLTVPGEPQRAPVARSPAVAATGLVDDRSVVARLRRDIRR